MILEMRKNGKPLRKTHSLSLCMHLRKKKHIFSSRSCCIRTVAFLWDFRTQQRGSWESRVASTCANAEPAQFSDPISISFIRCFCLRVRQQMLQQLSTEREDSYTKREKFFCFSSWCRATIETRAIAVPDEFFLWLNRATAAAANVMERQRREREEKRTKVPGRSLELH